MDAPRKKFRAVKDEGIIPVPVWQEPVLRIAAAPVRPFLLGQIRVEDRLIDSGNIIFVGEAPIGVHYPDEVIKPLIPEDVVSGDGLKGLVGDERYHLSLAPRDRRLNPILV